MTTTITDLKTVANSFLDGNTTREGFINRLTWELASNSTNMDTALWLAKAIAERDLPAKHRLIGVGK